MLLAWYMALLATRLAVTTVVVGAVLTSLEKKS